MIFSSAYSVVHEENGITMLIEKVRNKDNSIKVKGFGGGKFAKNPLPLFCPSTEYAACLS